MPFVKKITIKQLPKENLKPRVMPWQREREVKKKVRPPSLKK
jgi:hypothetical protein